MLSTRVVLAAAVTLLVIFTYILLTLRDVLKPPHMKRRQKNGKPFIMPPEPKSGSLPLLGHLLSLRRNFLESLLEWPKETGEFTTVRLGSTTWVLLNSSRVAHAILNKHGSVTNDRPNLPVVMGLISSNKRSVLMHQTDLYREKRRVYHQLLTGSAIGRYSESQELESTQLLAEYLLQPETWYLHNSRYANSVVSQIAFGKRTLSVTPLLESLFEVVYQFTSNSPPGNLIDLFPILHRLPKPLQWWRKRYLAIGARTIEVYRAYWRPVVAAVKNGTAAPSFSRDVLTGKAGKFHGDEDDAMFLAVQLVEAGSDTTRAALNVLGMAMTGEPDFVLKAREELDRVCGANAERMPNFGDEDQLRYILAAVKEVFRWRTIFPLTPPHRLQKDFEFEGYVFPEDTNFVLNNFFITQNLEDHKDPAKFIPERFLDGNESDVLNGVWTFGGGRKVCVGYRLAQRSLFINIAKILYCFDFEAVGEISKDSKFHSFTLGKDFPAHPKVRSEAHARLIKAEAERFNVWEFAKGIIPTVEEESL